MEESRDHAVTANSSARVFEKFRTYIIQGQVPWRVCEWLAAGEGDRSKEKLMSTNSGQHSCDTLPTLAVPGPAGGFGGWETSLTLVVTHLAGGFGLFLWWSACFHSPPTWCLDLSLPLKLSLDISRGPLLGDPSRPAERVSCVIPALKPPSSSTSCGPCRSCVAAGTLGCLCC